MQKLTPAAVRQAIGLVVWLLGSVLSANGTIVAPNPRSGSSGLPSPAQASAPLADEGCTVQVRFWDVGRGFYHAYILTLDRNGATHFRAGPANPGPSSDRIRAFLGWRRSRARSWGPLRAEHGSYVPGTVDYDSGSPPTMTLLHGATPCDTYNLLLESAEISVNSARIPYNPATTNSNAFVRYALAFVHVVPGPPPVRAPGWYTVLAPIQGARR